MAGLSRDVLTVPDAPPAFHLMAKPTGAMCNLDCEYCFFLSKEMLYPGSRFRMAEELQETYIRQLLEAQRSARGGDGLAGRRADMMGLDFFRRSVELQRRYARPGQTRRQHASRPTAPCSMTSGASSSGSTTSWSASRSTAPARCTTPTGWTRAASRPSTG